VSVSGPPAFVSPNMFLRPLRPFGLSVAGGLLYRILIISNQVAISYRLPPLYRWFSLIFSDVVESLHVPSTVSARAARSSPKTSSGLSGSGSGPRARAPHSVENSAMLCRRLRPVV